MKNALLAITLLLNPSLVAGCVDDHDAVPCPEASHEGATFADVHGLAVDPSNPSVLFVATHHGLFRGANAREWSKVGPTMDLMGFTMHPSQSNVFYASGHPNPARPGYTNLGLVKSEDGGCTWRTMGLKNEADFHAMTLSITEPETVRAYYHRDQHIYESTDGGATWSRYAPDVPVLQINSLASHATRAGTIYAGTGDGVWMSDDGGHTWAKVPGSQPSGAAGAIATTKADPDLLWAFFAGGPARSRDGGASWETVAAVSFAARDGPSAIAVDPADVKVVYLASVGGHVFKTTNEGAAWTQVQPVA